MPKEILKVIKELADFFGKKLDTIANKDSIGVEIKGAELVTIKGERGEKGDVGPAPVTISKTAPNNPTLGHLWYQP